MSNSPPSVFSFLQASPGARVVGRLGLGAGRSSVIWRNAHARVSYERPYGHALCLYLQGGEATRRLDGGARNGWPGALCLLPQGASSEWEIGDPFEFIHLYVGDDELRRAFTESFDRDAREMVLPEITFERAPALEAALRRLAAATRSGDGLMAEEAMGLVFSRLFTDARYGGHRPHSIKAGLAPAVRRRLIDYIEANLDKTITLASLAAIAGLSEYHLQRMFQTSCGVSPHGWVQQRRLACAKVLLAGPEPIAQIASACGFSSQSHLTRVFKAMTGRTPSVYRRSIRVGMREAV